MSRTAEPVTAAAPPAEPVGALDPTTTTAAAATSPGFAAGTTALRSRPIVWRSHLARAMAATRHTPPARVSDNRPAPVGPDDVRSRDGGSQVASDEAAHSGTSVASASRPAKRRCVAATAAYPLSAPSRPSDAAAADGAAMRDGDRPRPLAAAASLYLVPALHGAAVRRDDFFAIETVWRDRLIEASADCNTRPGAQSAPTAPNCRRGRRFLRASAG